jgi:ABC-type transport system involved in multi-copper enzyme maturation permease subunit
MTWLTWRQFRLSAATSAAVLVIAGAVLAITGVQLAHLSHVDHVRECAAGLPACVDGLKYNSFVHHFGWVQNSRTVVIVIPALLGVFWGAPLVAREFETGSFRLVWTQSVTRTRWLLTKMAVIAAISATLTCAITFGLEWWFKPFAPVQGGKHFSAAFPETGVAPMAYGLFALALGVVAGMVIRRTVAAMAVTLGAFAGARIAVTSWVRPHFMAPLVLNAPIGPGYRPDPTLDWVISDPLVTAAGKPANFECTATTAQLHVHPDACAAQYTRYYSQLHTRYTYQPATRYWTFQWLEAGLFVGFAVLLTVLAAWLIRRRAA